MPLYEYECRKCHTRTERLEKSSGPHLRRCPKCKAPVERVISRTAIQFKGSGWYVTDYAKSGSRGDSAKSDAAPAATPEKPAADSDTKSKPKPAAPGKGKKAEK